MVCFFTQGNGKKPLFGAIATQPCNILGDCALQVEYYGTRSYRAVVRRLKKLGVDGVAITADFPEQFKNALVDAGFAVFHGKKLMALMLPDMLRSLQKNYGLDPSVPIVVYGDASQPLCRRAVYDAVQFSRQVCLMGSGQMAAQVLSDEVLEMTGQTVSLCVPQKAHMAVWCGVQGQGALVSVNLGEKAIDGAVNTITLITPDGTQLDMAIAEGVLGDALTPEAIGRSGLKIKCFG
ncbi:MAG: hypothetical protein E7409_01665 [Ruminococcaceae bacterium]|nr:hypothetical protein [Oscillospiraceae bacterium]